MTPPLDGYLVLELASVLAGPSVGQFLAELGARVVKIENPRTGGDVTRSWRGSGDAPDRLSSYFCACNFGKESVLLDLRDPEGREALHRMARRADIVLTSFPPGRAAALGADADALRALNPRLVVGSVTGYGPTSRRTGYDALLQAETGWMAINGRPHGPPIKLPVAVVDLFAAHQLKEALLVALLVRERTGAGAAVSVSLFDAAVTALANQGTAWLNTGVEPVRRGSSHPSIAPYGLVAPASDGVPILLAVGNDTQFQSLCRVLDAGELADDARFRSNPDRVRHLDPLEEAVTVAIARFSSADLLPALHEAGVPAGALRPVSAALDDPMARRLLVEGGGYRGLRQAGFVADGPSLAPPPELGAHTATVLRELAGIDPAAG